MAKRVIEFDLPPAIWFVKVEMEKAFRMPISTWNSFDGGGCYHFTAAKVEEEKVLSQNSPSLLRDSNGILPLHSPLQNSIGWNIPMNSFYMVSLLVSSWLEVKNKYLMSMRQILIDLYGEEQFFQFLNYRRSFLKNRLEYMCP